MPAYKNRIKALGKAIDKNGLDSFLVTGEVNVRYLSGFEGSDSLLLFTPKRRYFITDLRYIEEAEESVMGFELVSVDLSSYDTLRRLARQDRLKRLGFESMDLPYEVFRRIKDSVRAKLIPEKDMVESIRAIKDDEEISLIKDSVKLTKEVLKDVLKRLRPGVSEESMIAEIEKGFILRGAGPAFKPIVAFGRNSSKPHAWPTSTTLKDNSHAMIDMGCALNGYCSDITRIAFFGRIKEKMKKICAVVSHAQELAIDSIRPGARIAEVDLSARRYIEEHGFGKCFGHSIGHGIGMEVHEKPSVSRMNNDMIITGMVFTVEPAIYIPKLGGIRVEDMVLVTNNGCEILTR